MHVRVKNLEAVKGWATTTTTTTDMARLLLLFNLGLCPLASALLSDGDVGIGNNAHNLTSFTMSTNTTAECYSACAGNSSSCGAWQMTVSSPACTGGGPAICTLKGPYGGPSRDVWEGAITPVYLDPCAISGPVLVGGAGALLQPVAFEAPSLSTVVPSGWLLDQLATQATTGLVGYLDLFYFDIEESVWVGGKADGYLHERGPYWLNGATPLAVLLENAAAAATNATSDAANHHLHSRNCSHRHIHSHNNNNHNHHHHNHNNAPPKNLTEQVSAYLATIVAGQRADGWLGPDDTNSGDMYWGRYNVLSSFLQWADGSSPLAIPRGTPPTPAQALFIPAIFRYVAFALVRMLGGGPAPSFQLNDWSAARVQDYLLTIYALLDNFAALDAAGLVPPGISEATLFDAAAVAHGQAVGNGAVWELFFNATACPWNNVPGGCFPSEGVVDNFGMLTHGVNVAQAIKSAAVWWRLHPSPALLASTYDRIAKLDAYHGSPSGVVQADEHLAGKEPQRGTELCGIVEALYSYETLGDVLGDVAFFDRAELIAYNAYPAAMTKDTAAHNYLSQANEVWAVIEEPKVFPTDSPDAATYGVAPNLGCCTANHGMGYSKFAARLIKRGANGSLAVTMWGPETATLTLPSGDTAVVRVDTEYPFGDTATVTVTAPSGTPVLLRIPSWATAATVQVDGAAAAPAANGTFATFAQPRSGAVVYSVDFAPSIRVRTDFFNGTLSVYRGALLYALQMPEVYGVLSRTGPFDFVDINVTTAPGAAPWNVALVVADPQHPETSLSFQRLAPGPPSPSPFNRTGVPVQITGFGRVLAEWAPLFNNSAQAPPSSPIDCGAGDGRCGAVDVPVTLVPYGSTLIRVAVWPWTTQKA